MTMPEIAVIGSANVDLVISVDHLARPGETVLARSTTTLPGGKGSNQALAAAKLGRRVAFVGRVGDDDHAQIMRDAWEEAGVVTDDVRVSGSPTGQALCFVDSSGESSIVVVSGANADVTPADSACAAVEQASVVLAQLEIPVDAVAAAAERAQGTFVLNAAPAQELPDALVRRVDVLLVNEPELEAVAGLDAADDDLAERLAAADLPPVVVITVGAQGARVWDDGALTDVPAPVVEAVDTTGAGDELAGALADALARGDDPVTAVRWAVAAASLSTVQEGATAVQPSADDVHRLLAD